MRAVPVPPHCSDFAGSFHAAPGLMLHGHVQRSAVLLYRTYLAGDGSPDRGWRIVLEWFDPERLGVFTVGALPGGSDAFAVDLCCVTHSLTGRSAPPLGQATPDPPRRAPQSSANPS